MAMGLRAAPVFPDCSDLPSRPGLPDPLTMLDGRKVATWNQWLKQRRPELKALFQHYMYGWFAQAAKVRGEVTYTDPQFFEGQATLKLVTLSFRGVATPQIHLMLVTPNHRVGPAPVFLGMNFTGNHSLVADTHVPLTTSWMRDNGAGVVQHHAIEAGRGKAIQSWSLETTIRRGYAVGTYYLGDVEPDTTNAAGGIRESLRNRPGAPDDWGTLAAWAWGLQRVVDYVETDRAIDKKHIALVGHSRLGKAAMLAGAFDERVALVVPLQAGTCGTAPSRGTVGESVDRLNHAFPHWMCGEFKTFGACTDRLPFDQHCLVAMCAPRLVLFGQAVEDVWANPPGAFDMLKGADKVYRLAGVEGISEQTMPETNKLVGGNLGYFIRPGKHSMTALDWGYFLDFADRHWGKPKTE
jgi:hypothetical protein